MALLIYTEKHFAGFLSMFNNRQKMGDEYEQIISKEMHEKYMPVLLSPLLLRRLGAGQVDLAYLDNSSREEKIVLLEIKKNKQFFSGGQRRRLGRSQDLVASIFEKDVVLRLV